MALLHYENLGVHRPDMLLRKTFFGLRDFYEFLRHTLAHLKDDRVVPRLAWSPAAPPPGGERGQGFWVELEEPPDRPDEPEQTFDAFLDEDVREVFELAPAAGGPKSRPQRVSLAPDFRLEVLDRDPQNHRLLLDRRPRLPGLCLRPNTKTLQRQLDALKQLQDAPAPAHIPLLNLFQGHDFARWPAVPAAPSEPEWHLLTDPHRPGAAEQRRFVRIALETPDFAFLDGPPGSGKTTAICELVLQLAARGKRVLLCASTHVAVDNVLERVGPSSLLPGSELVAVRIGDRKKVSEKARPFQFEELVTTERERLLTFLRTRERRSASQGRLLRSLSGGGTAIERMVLDAANLVCGTTTGVLNHPDIKAADASGRAGMFDVLILDEASKTTFQEFLVPALLAKRWIVVGDPRQLSPFVDGEAVAANLRAALPDEDSRDACVDVFLASCDPRRRRAAAVATEDEGRLGAYRRQAAARAVELATADDPEGLALAQIVVGPAAALASMADRMPLDLGTLRGVEGSTLLRRAASWRRRIDVRDDKPPRWEEELGWRLVTHFELRQVAGSAKAAKLWEEASALLPASEQGPRDLPRERVDRVRRVAFPSLLEALQKGFPSDDGHTGGTALTDGLPPGAFASRSVLLEYQQRMHPDISECPRAQVYGGQALKDPPDMAARREWAYARFQRRAVWLQVKGEFDRSRRRNEQEAAAVLAELASFQRWAEQAPKPGGGQRLDAAVPWEVAILAFYRGQERALREQLRERTGDRGAFRHFTLGRGSGAVRVELCTVDRFQGQEADVVFLSVASPWPTAFLESNNRMNVAITRARFLRVIVGNRLSLKRSAKESLLSHLAEHEQWEYPL